ncbi:MAG: rod shape-determining protein [Clostridiales bacterium]|nr:rod shape-determining protein [Clostridiales bacterium]
MASYNDIAIDLGTSQVLIYMKGKGIVLREPAVVAIDRGNHNVLAIGDEAQKMVGRTPGSILAIRPLRDGSVNDFELTSAMLRYFVLKVVGKRIFSRPKAIIAPPTGVNAIEKRSIISAMFDAGMRRTQLIDKPIAAAIGAGLSIGQPYGTMIIDISAGMSDLAVISMGNIVVGDVSKVGGDQFDDALIRLLRKKHNLLVGERTAEELKMTIGSAIMRPEQLFMDVTGRNLLTGLPKTMRITSDELTESFDEPLQAFIESIHGILENTPAELAADIFEYGIVLTGGGASLTGLPEAISTALQIPCTVADDPQTAVVMGAGRILEDPQALREYLDRSKRRFRK